MKQKLQKLMISLEVYKVQIYLKNVMVLSFLNLKKIKGINVNSPICKIVENISFANCIIC